MAVDEDIECHSLYQIRKGTIKGIKNERAKWHNKIYLTGPFKNFAILDLSVMFSNKSPILNWENESAIKQCLQCSGRSLSSSQQNYGPPCQWPLWLVINLLSSEHLSILRKKHILHCLVFVWHKLERAVRKSEGFLFLLHTEEPSK